MSVPNTSGCQMTLATLGERLELFYMEITQKLNYLICKEEANQHWKLGMESTMHHIWAKVCSQHFRISVCCQTDKRLEADHVILRDSSCHLNGTSRNIFEEENCFQSISEEDNESNQGAQHAGVEVAQTSSSSVHENTLSTSVVSAALHEHGTNRIRSEAKISYSCNNCAAKVSQYEKFSNYHDEISPNPTDEMSCLVFNDEEDQQSNSRDEQDDIVVFPTGSSSVSENESPTSVDEISTHTPEEISCLVNNNEGEQQSTSQDLPAEIIVVPTGSSSANENESSTSVVPDTLQEEPSKQACALRSTWVRSYSSIHSKAKSSQNDALLKHQRSHSKSIKPSFKCQRCSRVLSSRERLMGHDAVCQKRARKLPFECVTCGRSYDTREKLRTHSYQHREKKQSCPACGMAFLSLSNLNDHIVTHTGEQPFHCRFCTKQYTARSNLYRHVRTCHSK